MDHIEVYIDNVFQGSGYTVTLNSNQITAPGGNVTFTTPPGSGSNVAIFRVVPYNQEVDYTPFDSFPAETHEGALDKLTMLTQQNKTEIDRAVKYPVTEPSTPDLTLPPYVAGKGLMWDENTESLTTSEDDLNGITGAAKASADAAADSAALAVDSANRAASSE